MATGYNIYNKKEITKKMQKIPNNFSRAKLPKNNALETIE